MLQAIVNRPTFDENLTEHPAVRLTAVVSYGTVTKEYELNTRVKMEGITDSQAVIVDLDLITFPEYAFENLTLPSVGKNGSTIRWQSSTPAVITAGGVVIRPSSGEEDATVTLTAHAVKGEETNTKEYVLKVTAWTQVEEMEDAASKITWDLIKGANTNSQAITDHLILPSTIGRGVKIDWTTTSSYLDVVTGEITRPSYTQGQVTLRLVAELSHGEYSDTVELPILVISPLEMTDQEVLQAAKNALEASTFLGTNVNLSSIRTNMKLPYRVNDANASKAGITWKLATHTTHTPISTHPNIVLSEAAEWTTATVVRPTSVEGNQKLALHATITVGAGSNKITDDKYFDITVLVEETP